MLVNGTDFRVRIVFVCEETGVPREHQPVRLGDYQSPTQ